MTQQNSLPKNAALALVVPLVAQAIGLSLMLAIGVADRTVPSMLSLLASSGLGATFVWRSFRAPYRTIATFVYIVAAVALLSYLTLLFSVSYFHGP